MTRIFLAITIGCIIAFGCKPGKEIIDSSSELDRLAKMMSGYYNSAAQAAQDSQYFDISLTMVPIWENEEAVKWLYVEQAVTATIKKPYRQRVYRLTQQGDRFESKVFEIDNPDRYIHMWEDREQMKALNKSFLIEREGCSVFMKAEGNCYKGATDERSCKSNLRGASYATSVVELCKDKIVSWDQGWNEAGEQVWGAVKGGYVFNKIRG